MVQVGKSSRQYPRVKLEFARKKKDSDVQFPSGTNRAHGSRDVADQLARILEESIFGLYDRQIASEKGRGPTQSNTTEFLKQRDDITFPLADSESKADHL